MQVRHRPGKSRPIVVTVGRDYQDKAVFRYGNTRNSTPPKDWASKVPAWCYWAGLACLFLVCGIVAR